MYLVHADLRAPHPDMALPQDIGPLIHAVAMQHEQIEHISVHRTSGPEPVLGVYLIADHLDAAEAVVATLCRRAIDTVPALRGWSTPRVGAPLVTPFYERLLSSSGLAGRISPGPVPSI
ncbi:hypothetical protein [Kitasatospora sp. HPMI-4]|uniref:hypothetical protein n=1 Tax=Kitasatospora sp. HPMI-4 TaxID=3448443 RepID=UPI003F1A7D2C